jgi:hypothetical protein
VRKSVVTGIYGFGEERRTSPFRSNSSLGLTENGIAVFIIHVLFAQQRAAFSFSKFFVGWSLLLFLHDNLQVDLDAAHQDQNYDDEQNQSQTARRTISPVAAVTPGWQGAKQGQNQYDNQNGSKHVRPPCAQHNAFKALLFHDKLLELAGD